MTILAFGAVVFVLPQIFPLGIARDYPNHLARVFIQYRLGSDAFLTGNYALEWRLIPDLAMDLFAAPFMDWLSPYAVGGLFNGLTLALLFFATVALHLRRAGSVSLWTLLPLALLFNEALRWGFMNFLFGVGLALWAVYFWLATEAWPWHRRLLVFAAAQTVLFFAHLLGFLLCGYLVLCFELLRVWRDSNSGLLVRLQVFTRHMMQFALPLALFAYVLFGQDGVGDSRTFYGAFSTKALAFLSPTSALVAPAGPLVLLAILVLIYGLLRRGEAKLDGDLKPLLWAMAALVIAMPNMVLGIWGLDFRFPFIGLLLLVAAIRPAASVMASRLVQGLVLAMVGASLLAGGLQMARNDEVQQEIRQALRMTEAGGALLVAGDYDPNCRGCFPAWIDFMHSGSLAAIERGMFVPLLFTATSLVEAAPGRAELDVPHGWPVPRQALEKGRERALEQPVRRHDPAHAYWNDWPRNFDYLLWMRSGRGSLDGLGGLERLAEGEVFVLYRVIAPAAMGGAR
ncbi:hypothetical protein HBA54_01270 [Pelagibius litoralis]|uniref:Uncharacterized protein n=1 Tax=Pelagibius litoralis TaxID=374515 RepID=A0A967EUM2_9PROT|nr:hypothetical protein [Pelagibius litoralis]NIA67217.1 hypothetical protein [Pelagibius litoralis]